MAKRRTRSPHPGVVLIKPDPKGDHPTWRARYEDPDTGRTTKERLDPVTYGTAERRREAPSSRPATTPAHRRP